MGQWPLHSTQSLSATHHRDLIDLLKVNVHSQEPGPDAVDVNEGAMEISHVRTATTVLLLIFQQDCFPWLQDRDGPMPHKLLH